MANSLLSFSKSCFNSLGKGFAKSEKRNSRWLRPSLLQLEDRLVPITGLAGSNLPMGNMQPYLALNYLIAKNGVYPSSDFPIPGPPAEFGLPTLGEVTLFAGNFAPSGYALAQGQTLTITQNSALFSLMGTQFGGNGISSFALPNLQGQTAVGVGNGSGLTPEVLGQTAGAPTVTQIISNLPAHDHQLLNPGTNPPTVTGTTGLTGSGTPLNNLMPTLGLNYQVVVDAFNPDLIGEVELFTGSLLTYKAQGQVLPINQNNSLFQNIGSTFGGDGVTTFALPDMQGRVAVGSGSGPGLSSYTLGENGGTETVALTTSNLASHQHLQLDTNTPTSLTGGSQPFTNVQPFTSLTYAICFEGIYPLEGSGFPSSEPFVGQIKMFASNTLPSDFLPCDGSVLQVNQYQQLAAVLGATFGGNGISTFNLPDLRGRVPVGVGQDSFGNTYLLGQTGGTELNTMTNNTLATHSHPTSTFIVTSAGDSGPGTFREAVTQANATPGADAITFAASLAGQAVLLSTVGDTSSGPSALGVTGNLTLIGSGQAIQNNNAPGLRLFTVQPEATLTLSGLKIQGFSNVGGNGVGGQFGAGGGGAGMGGAIYNNQGTLNINGCTITGNSASGGNGGVGYYSGNPPINPANGQGGSGGNGSPGPVGIPFSTPNPGFLSPTSPAFGSGGYGGGINRKGNGGFGGGGGGEISVGYAGIGSGGGGNGAWGSEQALGVFVHYKSFAGGGGGGAGLGGAIFNNKGTITISNSTLQGNKATGGSGGQSSGAPAIYNGNPIGTLSTSGKGLAGGVYNYNGKVTVTGTTTSTTPTNKGATNLAFRLNQPVLLEAFDTDPSSDEDGIFSTADGDGNNAEVHISDSTIPSVQVQSLNGGKHTVNTGTNNTISKSIGFGGHTGSVAVRPFITSGGLSPSILTPINNDPGTRINLYSNNQGTTGLTLTPYPGFTGEVRVAYGKDGGADGEIITGPGPGGGPHIRILDARTGTVEGDFFAYDRAFFGGVFVALGDFTGDGVDEIVTGAGGGGGPHVKVFNGATKAEIASFFAYDADFLGGVSVAVFDANNDGNLDIVTGAGAGGGPHVKVFTGPNFTLFRSFMAFDTSFRGGVFVAIGDLLSDGKLEIVVGAGPGGGPQVSVFDLETAQNQRSFLAFDAAFTGGVRVGIYDANGDSIADLVAGAGPGGGPNVRVFSGANLDLIADFFTSDLADTKGVFVN